MIVSLATIQSSATGPALALLPAALDTPEAHVMLLAIGLQESGFRVRYQQLAGGGKGPARGFWQCERGTPATRGGVTGVALHPTTAGLLEKLCRMRSCSAEPALIWSRLEADDVLAAGVARLLLLSNPRPLPALGRAQAAWDCYASTWRPGKPHRDTWDAFYAQTLAAVESEVSRA